MPTDSDEDTRAKAPAEGSHDDLGVHPEHREAEVADLNKQFAAPSAPAQTPMSSGWHAPRTTFRNAHGGKNAPGGSAPRGFGNTAKPASSGDLSRQEQRATSPPSNTAGAPGPSSAPDKNRELPKNTPRSAGTTDMGSQGPRGARSPKNAGAADKSTLSGKDLKSKEESAPDRSGNSAADDMREKLGMGYTGKGSTKSKGLSKLYSRNSKLKKRIAIAGAAAGGSIIAGILVFLALLPLKIEHVVANLEGRTAAAADQAMGREVENLFSSYITKNVLPVLHAKNCHSTIDAGCIALSSDSKTPIGRLYNGWKDARLEQKMASKYGIVIGAKGNTSNRYYMTLDGKEFDFNGNQSIFDISKDPTTRNNVRHAVRDALKQGTLWDKTYMRYKVGKLLERKYGIKRCLLACDTKDKFTDSINDKKLAAKALLLRNMAPQKYGLIMQCVLSPDDCGQSLEEAKPGDTERTTGFQKQLQAQLQAYKAKYGEDKLKNLVKTAEDVSKDGFTKTMVRKAVQATAVKLGASEAATTATGDAITKAIPVAGWILLIGQIVHLGSEIGPMVQHFGYAANVATSVSIYESYNTLVSEMHSGHIDPTELGSFSQALSTNLSGAAEDQVDMTKAPMYATVMDSSAPMTASIFSNIFGVASADGTSDGYTCNDSKPVPPGSRVCAEEEFANGNATATGISNFINSIPGLSIAGDFIGGISGVLGKAASWFIDHVPGLSQAVGWLGSALGIDTLVNNIGQDLIRTPISKNMSGARTFDLMTAGAEAGNNCQETLACPVATTAAMNTIYNQYAQEQKEQFESMPLFARIFSTTSSYSLVSRMAMDMPASLTTATNSTMASILTNPVGKLFGSFASVFSGNQAFAATTPQADPFGIVQNAYNPADIPADPETFWQENCINGPLGKSDPDDTTGASLDISDWLNNPSNVAQDPNTGEAIYLKPNQCVLIQASTQSAGAMFDNSLAQAAAQ